MPMVFYVHCKTQRQSDVCLVGLGSVSRAEAHARLFGFCSNCHTTFAKRQYERKTTSMHSWFKKNKMRQWKQRQVIVDCRVLNERIKAFSDLNECNSSGAWSRRKEHDLQQIFFFFFFLNRRYNIDFYKVVMQSLTLSSCASPCISLPFFYAF